MKKRAIPLAILLLSSGSMVAAQENNTKPAPASTEAGADDIQKVVIVSTGSRGAQRTAVDTPVPIDIIGAADLGKTGQASLDKALQFRVPSFNTVQTPVNDATSLLDPYEIRNMGPSRSLILINGKRKNSSALVYVQTSPGRGESGADISAIPADAIKRIEVLRDGASAQYGSDAISGVINIILKDTAEGGAFTARAGMTGERDGKMGGASFNQGISLGGRGFVNYTVDVSKVGLAQRSGIVSAKGEAGDFGADLQKDVIPFLTKYPDARNINGSPATEAAKFLVNSRYTLSDQMSVYGNAAYVNKKVSSYANYRTPYWRPTDYGLLHAAGTPYEGYVPDFIGKLDDYNATGGVKFDVDGWQTDLSLTTGGNQQAYSVNNSVNRNIMNARADGSMPNLPISPTSFEAGGSEFTHYVLNGDVSKQVSKTVSAYFGTEVRHEKYETIVGDFASYHLGGADSFVGNTPENSFASTRSNYGVYGGSVIDLTDQFLIDGTGRYEKYSDFGSKFVWKLSSRFKFNDSATLRGSLSTGFRAPSLLQIFTQKTQFSFVPGQGIQVSGLTNNVSAQAQALGVPSLKPETSTNFTIGLGLKPDVNSSFTLDYYNIKVKDRIILGKEIKPSGDASQQLDKILKANNVTSLSFFVNALDSTTSGIDYVYNRKNLNVLDGKMTVNLSGNYSLKNDRDGAVNNPATVSKAGQSVLDATQEALMFTSRPKFKTILGLDLDYQKMNFSLNNTVFGPTTFRNAGMDENLSVVFKTKTVTDFAFNYQLTKNITLAFNINNLFNVTPEWKFVAVGDTAKGNALINSTAIDPAYGLTPIEVQRNLITFNGRYSMVTYDGSHFSQLGRMYATSLNWRF